MEPSQQHESAVEPRFVAVTISGSSVFDLEESSLPEEEWYGAGAAKRTGGDQEDAKSARHPAISAVE